MRSKFNKMKAINYYLIIEKIKEQPKKVGGLELTEDQNKDVRYLKGKVISAGNLVEGVKDGDIVSYDKHSGHGIEFANKLYFVIKVGDIVIVH
jgi:co-chaperonin GroES (HSP10)